MIRYLVMSSAVRQVSDIRLKAEVARLCGPLSRPHTPLSQASHDLSNFTSICIKKTEGLTSFQ